MKSIIKVSNFAALCRKANSKLGALGTVTPYMGLSKLKLLINSFLQWLLTAFAKYGYSMVEATITKFVWKMSSAEELLERYGSVSIHHKKIRAVAIEMFKNLNAMSPKIANDLFA